MTLHFDECFDEKFGEKKKCVNVYVPFKVNELNVVRKRNLSFQATKTICASVV